MSVRYEDNENPRKRRGKPKISYKNGKLTNKAEGQENKEAIFQFMLQNKGRATVAQIREAIDLSRETIHTHLKELDDERRIAKISYGEYGIRDLQLGQIYRYAQHMKTAAHYVIDAYTIKPEYDSLGNIYDLDRLPETRSRNLRNTVADTSVSERYSEAKFTDKDVHEKYLFEFANRIGAFIAYIFIESMRPLNIENPDRIPTTEKNLYTAQLICKAIDLDRIFFDFCRLFDLIPFRPLNKKLFEKSRKLTREEYEKLSKLFQRVYPSLYKGFENYWHDSVKSTLIESTYVLRELAEFDHNHEWKQQTIYKYKETCYVCDICKALSTEPIRSKTKVKGK